MRPKRVLVWAETRSAQRIKRDGVECSERAAVFRLRPMLRAAPGIVPERKLRAARALHLTRERQRASSHPSHPTLAYAERIDTSLIMTPHPHSWRSAPRLWMAALALGVWLALAAACTTQNGDIKTDDTINAVKKNAATDGAKVKDPGDDVKPGDATPPDANAAETGDGWRWSDMPHYGLRLKLPSHWEQNDQKASNIFVANPKPPADDSVVILMRVASQKEVEKALGRLDETFPMSNVRYTDQQKEQKINGMPSTFGEGVGFSKSFNTDLHFFIMLINTGDDAFTLMAVYIKEDVFAKRQPMVSEIIQSIERATSS